VNSTEHVTDDTDILTAALTYARRGWYIFPVTGKYPIEVGTGGRLRWSQHSTTDPEQIVAWYAGSSDLGIGLDCGKSGLVALDGDRLTDFIHWVGDTDLLAGTACWRGNPDRATFLFRQPIETVGCPVMEWGEVKGAGGYVVLPPSPHPEHGQYTSLSDVIDPTILPELIRVRLRSKAKTTSGTDTIPAEWLDASTPCARVQPILDTALASMFGDAAQPAMRDASMAILRLGEQGHQGAGTALRTLAESYIAVVTKPRDAAKTVRSTSAAEGEVRRAYMGAVPEIKATPTGWRHDCRGAACVREMRPLSDELVALAAAGRPAHPVAVALDGEIEQAVFGYSPILEHIRQAARAQLVGPWSTLGSVLTAISAETPPHVVLPAIVGGHGSLNLFTALVDSSGAGKSSSFAVARDLLHIDFPLATLVGQGTGEGLIASFLRRNPDTEERRTKPYILIDRPQVLMYVDEIGQMEAVARRAGSTVDATLRNMWNGQFADNNNADPDRRRRLPAHAYRLGLIAGVQPDLAGHLLGADAHSSGTAQRWLWMPVTDPHAPDDEPPHPGRLTWALPVVPSGSAGGLGVIEFPPAVVTWVRSRRRSQVRGEGNGAIESHAVLSRMKVAGCLALLHGKVAVEAEMWELSGALMRRSNTTRDIVLDTLSKNAEKEAKNRGRFDAARDIGRAEALEGRTRKAAVALWRLVHAHAEGTGSNSKHGPAEGCTARCVAFGIRNYPGTDRAEVVDAALAADWLVERDSRFFPGGSEPSEKGS
jgi:hypothetical protein